MKWSVALGLLSTLSTVAPFSLVVQIPHPSLCPSARGATLSSFGAVSNGPRLSLTELKSGFGDYDTGSLSDGASAGGVVDALVNSPPLLTSSSKAADISRSVADLSSAVVNDVKGAVSSVDMNDVKDVTFKVGQGLGQGISSSASTLSSVASSVSANLPAELKYAPSPETISGWEALKSNFKSPSVSLPGAGTSQLSLPNIDQVGLERLKQNLGAGGGSGGISVPDFNWPQGGVHSLAEFSQWLNYDIDDSARFWIFGGVTILTTLLLKAGGADDAPVAVASPPSPVAVSPSAPAPAPAPAVKAAKVNEKKEEKKKEKKKKLITGKPGDPSSTLADSRLALLELEQEMRAKELQEIQREADAMRKKLEELGTSPPSAVETPAVPPASKPKDATTRKKKAQITVDPALISQLRTIDGVPEPPTPAPAPAPAPTPAPTAPA
eukprot:CAMPEP_0197552494 /NCGR_PEP_ID=MMETSP1320-20131121/5951_1 /TAXON_ID=91990 /ORGANISM="Bolidomonas sp., Strain RCC2347" /LENGTH=438 /DNA_ID=CAMNT_0043113075 /DNA_START=34 /DNA_END=1346 /DNA_ORIENTATION=+